MSATLASVATVKSMPPVVFAFHEGYFFRQEDFGRDAFQVFQRGVGESGNGYQGHGSGEQGFFHVKLQSVWG